MTEPLRNPLRKLPRLASRVSSVPGLSVLSPKAPKSWNADELEGYLSCQRLAEKGAAEVASLLTEGMSERQAARLLDTWLADHGVRSFFHRSFAWFGERTRFDGIKTNAGYLPSTRVLRPGEIVILDVAPIYQGYAADIGYTTAFGANAALAQAQSFLEELRRLIPGLFTQGLSGGAIWRDIDQRISAAGYDNVHALYPFSVLGHRLHRVHMRMPSLSVLNFGLQSYWDFLSRGLFGQLLNGDYEGSLQGLWAIEPHLGGQGFGAKFEEILVVDEDGAWWLKDGKEVPG